jgi:hypothetical protein
MKSIFGLISSILIIQSLPAQVLAQFDNAVWDTLTTDTLWDALSSQSLAVNGYEEFHLAYSKARPEGGWNIYYRYIDVYGYIYPERVAESDMPCYHPAIASRYSDNDYDIIIVFESGGDIWGCNNHDRFQPWEFMNITNSPAPDLSPTIAWGASSIHGAWITYINSEYKIAYITGRNDSSSTEIIEDSQLGQFGSGAEPFIVAVGDEPHIFYRGVNGVGYHIHHAFKVHPDSAWTIEYVMTPNSDDYRASACINGSGDLQVAISGNDGFGFPGHVYFTRRDRLSGHWSAPALVTGSLSATNATIAPGFGSKVFIVSNGVSGNVYNGDVYLSSDTSGTFQTRLLGNYTSVSQAVIANIISEFGVVIFDAPIGEDRQQNIELVYYGPEIPTTDIAEQTPALSNLSRCYPNPFNSRIIIEYAINHPGNVKIDIFDILGRRIVALIDEFEIAGQHTVSWDASHQNSGIYFYKIQIGEIAQTNKVLLLK